MADGLDAPSFTVVGLSTGGAGDGGGGDTGAVSNTAFMAKDERKRARLQQRRQQREQQQTGEGGETRREERPAKRTDMRGRRKEMQRQKAAHTAGTVTHQEQAEGQHQHQIQPSAYHQGQEIAPGSRMRPPMQRGEGAEGTDTASWGRKRARIGEEEGQQGADPDVVQHAHRGILKQSSRVSRGEEELAGGGTMKNTKSGYVDTAGIASLLERETQRQDEAFTAVTHESSSAPPAGGKSEKAASNAALGTTKQQQQQHQQSKSTPNLVALAPPSGSSPNTNRSNIRPRHTIADEQQERAALSEAFTKTRIESSTGEPDEAINNNLPLLADLVHPKLLRGVQKAVPGIEKLTHCQHQAWGPLSKPNVDVMVRSQTGSGKTLAYALPLMHQMLKECDEKPIDRTAGLLILVLVPTRELALQVELVFLQLRTTAQFIVVGSIHGGEDKHKEKARLRKGVHILVSTPGRIVDHLNTTAAFKYDHLQSLVLDEADRILDMGFERDIRFVVSKMHVQRRRVLVSATITPALERLTHFALQNPVLVGSTEDKFEVPSTLTQYFLEVGCKHRLEALIAFLLSQLVVHQKKKIVVFMSTADATEFHYMLLSRAENPYSRIRQGKIAAAKRARLASSGTHQHSTTTRKGAKKLSAMANRHLDDDDEGVEDVVNFEDEEPQKPLGSGEDAAAGNQLQNVAQLFSQNLFKLHGNMSQVDRAAVFHSFKTCDVGVLFCTDVAARGLDMPAVDWVIHYDAPGDERCYIHRVGRTARIGNVGASLLFTMPHERNYVAYLSQFTHQPMEEKKLDPVLYHLSRMDRGESNWLHSAGTLHRSLCVLVRNDEQLLRVATYAYRGFIRAYAAYPRQVKEFFDPKLLHLGHVAHSFAIDMTPAELDRQVNLTQHVRAERELGKAAVKVGGKEGRGLEGRIHVRTDETYHSTLVQKQAKRSQDFLAKKVAEGAFTKPVFTEFDA